MSRAGLRALASDRTGATVVEFALVLPVLAITLMGLFDMAYNLYAASVTEGAVQKSARDATIQGASTAIQDTAIRTSVQQVVPGATVTISRKAYASFAKIGQAEDFTDANGDGRCNGGEPFEDVNGNRIWDADRGSAGQGGARDAVLLTVTATYRRAFPIGSFIGLPADNSLSSVAVLRNQPFDMQSNPVVVSNCA